ncbi:MAG: hypothetical protein AAB578_03060, partial [Elusimicrobiota bacterium]
MLRRIAAASLIGLLAVPAALFAEQCVAGVYAMAPWSRLLMQVTDAAGAPLQNVTLRAEVSGAEVGRATSDAQG